MKRKINVKPGKTQSMAGFFGGLLFCFAGLFLIIPTFGTFGIIWTLFALVITIMNGINAFTEKGVPTHRIEIEEESQNHTTGSDAPLPSTPDIEMRLRKLTDLYEKGIITGEDFEQKKQDILKDL